ncbi:MAG: ABC transporter ATP-binding protein [Verrucomicrobia bacterium]|jgi:ABC-type multidrug transport system fused ATPase/permease subunit|nr:ABC transporter ATP-binding protein [Verrucomicrobiota bacterium]
MSSEQTSEKRDPEEAQERALSMRLMLRMAASLGGYKWLVFVGFIMVCICAWSDMQVIHEATRLIRRGVPTQGSIALALVPLAIMCVINRVFGWLQWVITIFATNRAMAIVRKQFFAKLHTLSKSFFDQHKTGWLVARSTGDLAILQEFMTFALMMLGVFVTITISALYRIAGIAPILLAPAAIMMPLVLIATAKYKNHMTRIQRSAREQNSRLVANMAEAVRGIRVVQAFSRQERNLEDFNAINLMNHDTEIRSAKLDAVFLPSLDFISVLNITMVVAFAAWLIKHPNVTWLATPLTTADVVAYVLYMNVILWPTRMIVEIYSMAIRAMAAAERVFEIIDMPPTVVDPENPLPLKAMQGSIRFSDVSFRYETSSAWILRNFNLHITPGETVALVGKTGAGKTTIASLISRFYDVQEGAVHIDGHDVRAYRQSELHATMGIVLQQGFLFSGSVMDNLRFRQPDLSRDAVITHAKQLGTHDAIMALSAGYDTEVLEGGESISLGQRQVISITRALLAAPSILILDEPTSSLDSHTEAVVQLAIGRLIQNRTTIIIAHRLSTVRHADRILVIGDGRILEEGSHGELLDQGGAYSELIRTADTHDYLA